MTTDNSSQTKTDVGNYFVSNYPVYSQWTPEHVPEAVAALNQPPRPTEPLGLYLHIPFCRKRCKFCYFKVYTDKNSKEIQTYLEALAREIEMLGETPAFQGREPRFVYFGGGTPSYLADHQLRYLVERINQYVGWKNAEEVTFECEPGTLKKSKLETLKEIGITRLSLGVENFNDELLDFNGRAHKSPEIYRAYEWIREVGFPNVNIDLIAGMMGETEENWKDCVKKAIELEPDSVTIYQMELPFNTVISRDILNTGAESPIADWPTKRRWTQYAIDQFKEAGYEQISAYTLGTTKKPVKFVYTRALWHGADMIGTGVSAISHFAGIHYQNEHSFESYVNRIDSGELPIARALPLTKKQLFIREFILQLKLGHVDFDYFRDKFSIDPGQEYASVIAKLEADNKLSLSGDTLRVTPEGMLQVDWFLPEFFEPEQRNVRYA